MNIFRKLRSAIPALLIAFTIPIGLANSYGMREKPTDRNITGDKDRPGKDRKWPNFKTRNYPMVVNEKKEMRQQTAEFSKKKHYLREYERVIKRNDKSSLRDPWAPKRTREKNG